MSKIRGELRQLSPARRLLGLLPVLVVALAVAAALGGVGVASADEPEAAALAADAGSAAEPAAEAEPESEPAADPAATDPAPAQTLTATLPDGTTVKVEAPAGALPQGTTLEAKAVQNDAVTQAVTDAAKADGTELTSVKAIDVTLRDAAGRELEPGAAVKVTLSNTGMGSDDVSVYHVTAADGDEANASSADELTVNAVDTQKAEADEQVFTTDSFSIYVIGETARLKVNFHQADGTVKTIYVTKKDLEKNKLDDIVYDPGCGTLTGRQIFKGWSTVESSKQTVDTKGMSIDEVRDDVKTNHATFSDGDVVDYYPNIVNAYKVTYLFEGDNPTEIKIDWAYAKSGDTSMSYTVTEDYTPAWAERYFNGWKVKDDTSDNTYNKGDSLTVTPADIQLMPQVLEGNWLVFDGNGGSYTSPQFVKSGEHPTQPDRNPIRKGYTFTGWYTTADGHEWFDFSKALTQRTTAFAHWNAAGEASYTVNIWKQPVSGTTDKTQYDFSESVRLTGIPDYEVDVQNSGAYATIGRIDYRGKVKDHQDYTGFSLDSIDSVDTKIDAAGNTVVNVYYKRNTYTLTFEVDSNTVKTITELYGADITDQFPIKGEGDYEGIKYEGYEWYATTGSTFNHNNWLLFLQSMPAESITFRGEHGWGWTYTFNYNLETLPGGDGTTYGNKTYVLEHSKTMEGSGVYSTRTEDFVDVIGFTQEASDPAYNSEGRVWLGRYGGKISFYYTRNKYGIAYLDGAYYDASGADGKLISQAAHSPLHETGSVIPYEASLNNVTYDRVNYGAAYGAYVPTEAQTPAGYVFAGWYSDPTCEHPYNPGNPMNLYNVESMPANTITVYAKWVQRHYQVKFDLGEGKGKADLGGLTNPMNVAYDAKVNNGTVPDASWTGHDFLGWYKDAECTQPFNFQDTLLNEESVKGLAFEKGEDGAELMGTVTLYAKWRTDLSGTEGIKVQYDPTVAGTINGSSLYTDPTSYGDKDSVIAQNAAKPNDGNTQQFLNWQVQRWDGEQNNYVPTEDVVYPGDTFTVNLENAKPVTSDGKTAYYIRLVAQYGDATSKTVVLLDANGGNFGKDASGGDVATRQHTYDVNADIPSADFAAPTNAPSEGYEFLGWSATKKDEWTEEEFAQAKDTIDPKKTYAADNLPGMAWQDGTTKKNVLYACWKKKPVTLTIQKEITGAQADLTKGYTFKVTKGDKSFTTKKLYDTNGENGTGQSVTLGGDKKTGLELLWGDTVTVTETDNTGYSTTYKVTVGKTTTDGESASASNVTLNGDTTIVFTNTKTDTVVTGIKSAGVPGAVTAVGAAALAIAGGFAYVRRGEAEAGAHSRRRGRR